MTKKPAKKDLSEAIESLALAIATEANLPGVDLVEKVEAMKVLATYDLGMVKLRGKESEPREDGPRFGEMQDRLRSVK